LWLDAENPDGSYLYGYGCAARATLPYLERIVPESSSPLCRESTFKKLSNSSLDMAIVQSGNLQNDTKKKFPEFKMVLKHICRFTQNHKTEKNNPP
jgi:hypothetical protein